MSHVRKQIRDATATALAGVATVYTSRVYPVQAASLPVILVYSGDEQIEGQHHVRRAPPMRAEGAPVAVEALAEVVGREHRPAEDHAEAEPCSELETGARGQAALVQRVLRVACLVSG